MRKGRGIFITGSDTGVGKTVAAGLLGRFLSERGYEAVTQKWVETGTPGASFDIKEHKRLMRGTGKVRAGLTGENRAPYTFKFPASPHLAASMEKKEIRADSIKSAFMTLAGRFDYVIAEGAGGVLVPLSGKRLIIDIARDLKLPVVVVVDNRLGAINHTLLTIEALRRRSMKLLGVIFNHTRKDVPVIISRDNPRIVQRLSGEHVLGVLPWRKDTRALYKEFKKIGRKLERII